jgi:hypothetical protein
MTAVPAWSGEGGAAARRAAWIGTTVAIALFLLLATNGRPWALFDRGPFTSDFYDVQARALSRGHLDVPAAAAGIEGYVVDGETHFYYGLVPALARLPISAVTTAAEGRLVVVSQLAGLAVACLAGARLLRLGRRALALDLPSGWEPWLTGIFAAGVGLATPLLWLSSRALVYHEAELWGAALALLGFERVVLWWDSRRAVDLATASAVAALALSTRGSSGTGPALALGGLAAVLLVQRRWRLSAWAAAAAALPFVLYAAVNFARFGMPFSIPFDRQVLNAFSATRRAALADNGNTLFGLKFVPTTVLQYFRPDTLEPRSLLPWFSWGNRAHLVGDVTFDTVDRAASLPVTAPAFLATGVVGVVALFRHRPPAAWAMSLAGAGLATLPTLSIAFVAQRYLADFVPLLVLAAALGTPVAAAWAARSAGRWRAAVVGTAVLAAFALFVNAGLTVLSRRLYLLPDPAEQRAFVALQYRAHDALGGSRPPHVSLVSELDRVGPDGAIAIVGDCDALYRSDGESWRAIELRPGGTQRVIVDGEQPGPVVHGDGWRIDLIDDGDGRRLAYVGEVVVEGEPIQADGPLRVDIAADPSIPTVTARVDGDLAVEGFLRPAGGPLVVEDGWQAISEDAELCEDLLSDVRG